MSIDYSPVGGIGLEVTDEIRKKLVVANKGDFDGDMNSLLSDLEFNYEEAGDGSYSGDDNIFYIMVDGDTLTEVNKNVKKLIKKLSSMKIEVDIDSFKIISDLHVW